MNIGVRGFPTFHFYVNQNKVDELVGADPNALKAKIEQWRTQSFNPFASGGNALGSSSSTMVDPRQARLEKLAGDSAAAPVSTTPEVAATNAERDREDARLADELAQAENDINSTAPPPVNEEILAMLQDMGFPEIRAKKALLSTSNEGLEQAIQWLEVHQDDADIDEPIQCLDLSSGKSSSKKPLTAEEKAAKVEELKARIAARRAERSMEEKQTSKQSEIQRREMGKQMAAAREEYEKIQRDIEYKKRKKEKEDARRERERLRAEIAKDKAERRARGGKLYGRPITTSEDPAPSSATTAPSTSATPKPVKKLAPKEKIDESIEKLKKYRIGNDGLTAIKTLNVYVKNLVEKPGEDKFRTINLNNAAFKKRVAGLVGGISFLTALGYKKNEDSTMLNLSLDDRDESLLQYAQTKLQNAITQLS